MADWMEDEFLEKVHELTAVSRRNVVRRYARTINSIRRRCLILGLSFSDVLDLANAIADKSPEDAPDNTLPEMANAVNRIRRVIADVDIPFEEIITEADAIRDYEIQ